MALLKGSSGVSCGAGLDDLGKSWACHYTVTTTAGTIVAVVVSSSSRASAKPSGLKGFLVVNGLKHLLVTKAAAAGASTRDKDLKCFQPPAAIRSDPATGAAAASSARLRACPRACGGARCFAFHAWVAAEGSSGQSLAKWPGL